MPLINVKLIEDVFTSAVVLPPASTVSVAPKSRALSSRNLFVSTAMTREAPHRPVVKMAPMPTPGSATTTSSATPRSDQHDHARLGLVTRLLTLDGDHLTEARHCMAYQLHEPVIDVSCSGCGDGPMITGQPPELGDQLAPPALDWLHPRGWQLHPRRLCPGDQR